jgi:hypothetical protein
MCTWEPLSGMPSPDRLDALVWALTDLAIGGGPLVYAQAEEQFVCEPMRIPAIWQRVYAIDFDNSYFAAVWGAHDRSTGNIYLYDAYLAPRTDLSIHADEVRQRGGWIPGLFEPWARGRSEAFGLRSIDRLVGVGLDLFDVTGDPEEGVAVVAEMLTSGRLRVFRTMDLWLTAYRQYQRTDDGDLVDRDDHLMRATAPLVLYGPEIAISEIKASIEVDYGDNDGGWNLAGPRSSAGY